MIRYLIFSISDYYPAGGMDDCIYKTDDLQKAKEKLKEAKQEGGHDELYIYDIQTDEEIEG